MTLEWITLLVITSLIVTSVLFVVLLGVYLKIKRQMKEWAAKKPSRRTKNKRWRKRKKTYQQQLKRAQISLFGLACLLIIISLGGYFSYRYQLTNLSQADSENMVKSVALLAELKEQLISPKEKDSAQKRAANFQQVTVKLASYASKNPAYGSSERGRQLIKRYYVQLGELGINTSSQNYHDLMASEKLKEDYLADITKVKQTEKHVFEFYHLNLNHH